MSLNKVDARRKLTKLWKDKSIPELKTVGKKYVMFSDLHLGDNTRADDFRKNTKGFQRALDYYKRNGYTLIFLGDIEEFWQFSLKSITSKYQKSVYNKIKSFGDNRIIRIFGNHDIEWSTPTDPMKNKPGGSGVAVEAVKLNDKSNHPRILLVHGHQGSTESDKNSWFSRFFVRLYKPFERIIDLDTHSSATKSQVTTEYEKILYNWAKDNKVILICGHSHRAIFASKSYWQKLVEKEGKFQQELLDNRGNKKKCKEIMKKLEKVFRARLDEEQKNRKITTTGSSSKPKPCYFNSGCGLFTDGITAIELDNDELRMAKWHRKDKGNKNRIVFKDCTGKLSDFVKEVV